MQKGLLILCMVLLSMAASAQVVFKTYVKDKPVAVGESFIVQFVLEDADPDQEFYAPDFNGFRVVNGPYIHSGTVEGPDGPKKLKNIVYTLEATRVGRFLIKGATATVNGNFVRCEDVWVKVVVRAPVEETVRQFNAEYFLKPGEDPYKKMRDNLYLKVMVDKRNCFVGEPITATYKLYSRLVSRSAIIKNPGFYGFTVHDMIGLDDKKGASETINGKRFDVHIIRKVQLYPLRAGEFVIDPMEVSNKVEFSRNVMIHQSEQEITEGVVDDKGRPVSPNAEEFENNINTPPITITVKAPPEKNQPAEYTGATGHFYIKSYLEGDNLARNREGKLIIEISGKGNFTQLTAPGIKWPDGVEGFDPTITDTLNESGSPLTGKRTFIYSFVSARAGNYTIPSIDFSFFDLDSNRYKTISTEAQKLVINNDEVTDKDESVGSDSRQGNTMLKILGIVGIAAVLALGGWIVWAYPRAQRKKAELERLAAKPALPTAKELLQPAYSYVGEDKGFYATLRHCIWKFFSIHSGLTGSKMNIRDLQSIMIQKQLDNKSQQVLVEILQECETGIFTDAHIPADRKGLLNKTEECLQKMEA